MRVLLEDGIDPCSLDISSGFAGPGFEANVLHMEAVENTLFVQFQFRCDASGPLAQQDSSTRNLLDTALSIDVVFSWDRSSDRFTGKPVSQTTGLDYYYHRWYDPTIGRFLSVDPKHGHLSNPQSLNPYIYVLDIPTVLKDPSGLDWWNPFTWTSQQQAQAFTIAVVAVSVVAVVASGGLAAPVAAVVIGSAVGASASTTVYTVTQGSKATLAGAVGAAASGGIAGAIGGGAGAAVGLVAGSLSGSLGGTAAALIGTGTGAFLAGTGAVVGDVAGGLTEQALGGKPLSVNGNQLALDFGVAAITFGIGQRLGVDEAADQFASARTANAAGDVKLDTWLPGTAAYWEAEGVKETWNVGTAVFGVVVGGLLGFQP